MHSDNENEKNKTKQNKTKKTPNVLTMYAMAHNRINISLQDMIQPA